MHTVQAEEEVEMQPSKQLLKQLGRQQCCAMQTSWQAHGRMKALSALEVHEHGRIKASWHVLPVDSTRPCPWVSWLLESAALEFSGGENMQILTSFRHGSVFAVALWSGTHFARAGWVPPALSTVLPAGGSRSAAPSHSALVDVKHDDEAEAPVVKDDPELDDSPKYENFDAVKKEEDELQKGVPELPSDTSLGLMD